MPEISSRVIYPSLSHWARTVVKTVARSRAVGIIKGVVALYLVKFYVRPTVADDLSAKTIKVDLHVFFREEKCFKVTGVYCGKSDLPFA